MELHLDQYKRAEDEGELGVWDLYLEWLSVLKDLSAHVYSLPGPWQCTLAGPV